MPVADLVTARAAKRRLTRELASLDGGINGIGLSRRHGDYSLTVGVTEERWVSRVPHEVEGVSVRVKVVGRITPA